MTDPNDLAAFLELGWRHLQRGVADSRSPARYPTFATVSPEGLPEARTVALRRALPSEALIEVHTDIVTPKVQALHANPVAALHVWVPRANLQIRLTCDMEVITGPEVDADWARIPPTSRVSYGTAPDPGTPIETVHDYEKPPLRDRFAVLRGHVRHMDLVELGEKHRRAAYQRADAWAGRWLAP